VWNPATITALAGGVGAVITAITVLVRTIQHANDPNAHGGQGH
jgi:hypothetical protein